MYNRLHSAIRFSTRLSKIYNFDLKIKLRHLSSMYISLSGISAEAATKGLHLKTCLIKCLILLPLKAWTAVSTVVTLL